MRLYWCSEKVVEFVYREEASRLLGKVLRPVAEVDITADERNWFPALLYIDSGADISVVPRSFGELLGLDLSKNLGEVRGVGDAIVSLSIQVVKMKIGGEVLEVKVGVAQINEVPYILGRHDVFNLFKITFEEKNKKISFDKI